MHEWIVSHCFAGRGSSSIWASLPSLSQISPYIPILLPALQGQCMLFLCLYSTGDFNLDQGWKEEVGGRWNLQRELWLSCKFKLNLNQILPLCLTLRGHVQEVSEIFGELDEAQFCSDRHLVDQVTSWRGLHTPGSLPLFPARGFHQLLQRVSGHSL